MRPAIAAGSPARSTTRVPARSASVIVTHLEGLGPDVDLTLVSDYLTAIVPSRVQHDPRTGGTPA